MKNIVILGSTGSIGVSALDVIHNLGVKYKVLALSAHSNLDLFLKQVAQFKPRFAVIMDEAKYKMINKRMLPKTTKILPPDPESLLFLSSLPTADLIINALVGAVGLQPLMTAIKNGKSIALANKEPIVMAGETIMEECFRWKANLLPVDSEPSAIFQSLEHKTSACCYRNFNDSISKLLLTASGGPFLKHKGSLSKVTPEQALAHPRWKMGKKITIDSSTLMNKGFEAIEIMHLFAVPIEKVQIVVHPQSIIHSAVEYKDGSVIAQMSNPDMRLPIQYAVTYPEREKSPVPKMSLFDIARLDFTEPDFDRFPCLDLALWCAKEGGSYPAVLSAADEIAVAAFLKEEIKFTDIAKLIYTVIKEHTARPGKISILEAMAVDAWAREKALDSIQTKTYKKAIL
ncbi:1-deoxy-D-xylulose-5-phosphate reductoisomerase [Parelusimicrobium proximum]|uniref:1-deoxy-D-xylulose-5-phosphate reductoisomerase n=1 Tax=Parelusimicrobium proximum TaxID=3228953 RepID=UPI003D1867FD